MDAVYLKVAQHIRKAQITQNGNQTLVGISGPPGSGKSTIAQRVKELLEQEGAEVAVVPMDGFHLTRDQLYRFHDPVAANIRRGAPWTFDVDAMLEFIAELSRSAHLDPAERKTIFAPSFDHTIKDPMADAIAILPTASIIILEGNYLLLDGPKWRDITDFLDYRIFVDVKPEIARQRVAQRHVQAGIEHMLERAIGRFESNDALNGELVRICLTRYDLWVESCDDSENG